LEQVSRKGHLPHDLEAEQAVLGGVLLRNELVTALDLDTDDFYDPRHKAVFGAMRTLESKMRPIDEVTVADELGDKLEPIGGYAYIGELALRVPTADNVEYYGKIVKKHSVSRSAILVLADVVDQARKGELSGEDVIIEATSRLSAIATRGVDLGATMGTLIRREFASISEDLAARKAGDTVFVGVPTSLAPLDDKIGGIPLSLLTIIAGRPGCGKTTLTQTLLRAAEDLTPDTPIFYSYEDGDQNFAQREIAALSQVPTQSIRARDLTREEFSSISANSGAMIKRRSLLVQGEDIGGVDALVRDVKRRRMKARAEGKSVGGLVIVDYLQSMPMPEMDGRTDEKLGYVCLQLRRLAKAENIAVILCSQFNRGVEQRENKRPMMSDLRDSGKIEEYAKLILGLYRPGLYEKGVDPSQLDILVLKNHLGEANAVATVHWSLATHSIVSSRGDIRRSR
jgi:replicative DNA helicase